MQLGKYEIMEELGQGGFGVVYKAKDLSLDRLVALKVLHPQLAADVEFVHRFQREAKSLAKLDHPNIVTIHEFGEVEGRYFIAMRYLQGGNLAQRIKASGGLPFEETLRLARQLVAGLNYAHGQGLIHRDMKPANILFDQNQNAVISDFGLAKVAQDTSSASSSMGGVGVGTPYYKAPEIWRGKQATRAADQYSLACILVEMLTGKVLFDADSTPTVMLKHFERLELPESLPKEIHSVIAKALSKEPDERYSNLNALLVDFETAGMPKRVTAEQSRVGKEDLTPAPKRYDLEPPSNSTSGGTPQNKNIHTLKQASYAIPETFRPKRCIRFIALLGIAVLALSGIWLVYDSVQATRYNAITAERTDATTRAGKMATAVLSREPNIKSTSIPNVRATQTPSPSPMPPIPVVTRPAMHAIQSGENVYCLARRYDVDPADIMSLNNLSEWHMSYIGEKLVMPQSGSWPGPSRAVEGTTHPDSWEVEEGDTVYSIACAYGDLTPEAIIAVNGLKAPYDLTGIKTLQIP